MARTGDRASGLVATVAIVVASMSAAVPARAQSDAENKAAARAIGIDGIKLANAGDCESAIDKLQRAEQLFHAPTILGRLGECQVQVGQLVAGTENLNRVVREDLGPNPPAAFVRAKERARGVLQEALPKIAKLTISVEAPDGAEYQVALDGQALPGALVGVERPIDPGEHQVLVSGAGYLTAEQAVTLPEGGVDTVTLTLAVDPNAAASEPPPAEPSPTGEPATAADQGPADDGSTARIIGYISLGVGGVGLAVGTVFGLSASGTKSDLEGVCTSGRCPPDAQDDIDSMNLSATLSTVGFGVGIAGIGVGTYLLLTAGGGEEAPPTSPSAGLEVRPWIGVGSAGVTGRF